MPTCPLSVLAVVGWQTDHEELEDIRVVGLIVHDIQVHSVMLIQARIMRAIPVFLFWLCIFSDKL